MEQLNRIELRGNVGNVKIQEFSDNKVVRLSVATNYMYKNKDGISTVETTWHNVSAWQNQKGMPDFSRITKGMAVYVVGRLRFRAFEGADGDQKQFWEVIASKLELLDSEGNTLAQQ